MKNRDTYLNKLIELKDTSLIKVITGLRRTGKSSLLKLMVMYLKKQGIKSDRIIEMNFDSKMNCDDIYEYVNKKVNNSDEKIYIFLDGIQKVQNWEEVVNAFRVNFNSDIYIASSSACKLSKEYVEIKMFPLSFKEFLYFNNNSDISKAFEEYLHFGAMPQIVKLGLEQEDIYSTVVIKDILEKEGNKVTDILLLKKIVMHLADNIGNNLSISSVAKALSSSVNTIQTYIQSLLEAYMFYEIKRFDIKGKQYLKTLGKYYIVDLGLRNYLLGFRNRDSGHIIENIVYFELLRRGYDVAIGKVGDLEIDFIATKVNSKVYVQVTESMLEESTREREIKPLKNIDDNYEKIILTLNCGLEKDYDGIKVYNLIEWLLGE
ncbi:ATP-binding protein [Sneathia vaginalis]|uniref:ATP-binding protein n=1 Tax=Sneathia vaginalis TaxID=187101 RepID=UPI0035C6B127